jgi:hypothetical protein
MVPGSSLCLLPPPPFDVDAGSDLRRANSQGLPPRREMAYWMRHVWNPGPRQGFDQCHE